MCSVLCGLLDEMMNKPIGLIFFGLSLCQKPINTVPCIILYFSYLLDQFITVLANFLCTSLLQVYDCIRLLSYRILEGLACID